MMKNGLVNGVLPTGVVTLLLTDLEGSTPMWDASGRSRRSRSHVTASCSTSRSKPMEGCGRRSRARATVWSRRSPTRRTRSRPRSTCSGPSRPSPGRTRCRYVCASHCTPARCRYATIGTTRGRRSSAPRGCGAWRTAARSCAPSRCTTSWSTGFPTRRRCATSGRIGSRVWAAPSTCGSSVIPTWRPSSRRCTHPTRSRTTSRCC